MVKDVLYKPKDCKEVVILSLDSPFMCFNILTFPQIQFSILQTHFCDSPIQSKN